MTDPTARMRLGSPVAVGRHEMKISARNILKGTITGVTKGATTSHVKIDVNGTIVTASITARFSFVMRFRQAHAKSSFANSPAIARAPPASSVPDFGARVAR